MVRAMENAESIFKGDIDSIEVLIEYSGLENINIFMQSLCEYDSYFELMGHSNPCLKVLEIGAGTGGTTEGVLKGLTISNSDKDGRCRHNYARYDYTDISVGFFAAARHRFRDYGNIQYRVLDITQQPAGQGFEEGTYDLVLASNV